MLKIKLKDTDVIKPPAASVKASSREEVRSELVSMSDKLMKMAGEL